MGGVPRRHRPNTTVEEGAIVTAGSVAVGMLEAMRIYMGNPAVKVTTHLLRP